MAPLGRDIVGFVRRNHGYIFAWATIYTFWYHPMENTNGHLIGGGLWIARRIKRRPLAQGA